MELISNDDYKVHLALSENTHPEIIFDNLVTGQYGFDLIDLVIRYLVKTAFRISSEQNLRRLTMSIPLPSSCISPLAHQFALRGYPFTIHELLALGDVRDYAARSVGHFLAKYGRIFSPAEINQLGNPKDITGRSIADEMYLYQHHHQHRMAERGKIFTMSWDSSGPIFIGNHRKLSHQYGYSPSSRFGYHMGKDLKLDFMELILGGEHFLSINTFVIRLGQNETRVACTEKRDLYNAASQSLAITNFSNWLTDRLQTKQKGDLAPHYHALQLFCEDIFIMDVVD